MTLLPRFAKISLLPSLVVLALCVPALASTSLSGPEGSPYGSYLAGQEALRNLATGDAARLLENAATLEGQNAEVVQRAFIAYMINGDIDRAAQAAPHLLELEPDFSLAKLVLAASAMKDGRFRTIEKQLEGQTPDDFAGIGAIILRSWAFIGDGHNGEAFAALDKISTKGLGDFLVYHRALMSDVVGNVADATSLAGKAYQQNPTAPRMVELYARILGDAGRYDDALAIINKYNDSGFGDPAINAVKASIEKHQAPGQLTANVQQGAAEMFHNLGVTLALDGSNDLAIGMLQIGAYLDPHNDGISLLTGQLLDDAGQDAAANGYYSKVPDTSPVHLQAAVRIAQNYDSMGNRAQAIKNLTDLIAANPTDASAMTVLADLLRSDKRYDDAARIYSQALDLDKGDRAADWVLYYERGIVYERGNEWAKAEPDFLKALQLNPGQPQVLNYLGYSWVDKGENLDKALDMIQKAVKATPTDGFIIDSLGWAYYRLGRFTDAVSTLEQAVQFKPNDAQINDHLGDAYWRAGRKLEAHFQWNVAASLDTDGTLKGEISKKQASGLDATTASATATQ